VRYRTSATIDGFQECDYDDVCLAVTFRFIQLFSAVGHRRSVDPSQQPCMRRYGNVRNSDVWTRKKV